MKTKIKIRLSLVLVLCLLQGAEAQQRKRNITSAEAAQAVGEVAAFQNFPADYRLTEIGSVLGGELWFHIFTCWLKEPQLWRTLVFDNGGAYLGYYETRNEPVELERSGIVFPGHSYSVESGDAAEGEYDSGDAHIVGFSELGPPDEVKFEKKAYRFISSPKRLRPDAPGFRFSLVAGRMVDAMNHGRYLRIRDDFAPAAQEKLSEERTKTVFANLRIKLGKVERLDTPWVQAEDTAVFPITFDKGVLGLKLTLDAEDRITGLWILPYKTAFPDIGNHAAPITLPFDGRWRTMWGGDNRQTSKYFGNRARHHAREFVIADRHGKTYREEGKRNEDYFAFGRPVLAPAAGQVVAVVDGVEDSRPHAPNSFAGLGNMVVIAHASNEVSVLGHLMNGSIGVHTGEVVTVRQPLARCGNSGDSTQPSLYYHLQDSPAPDTGSGYRPEFRGVLIWNQNRAQSEERHAPLRGEYVEHHALPAEE
jgi:murein DD-endopeptidase MepM/ murein hydrolase activator NlpD